MAHYWGHPAVAGVDLMRARYVRHGFGRHTHDTFAIGVVRAGTEELRIGDVEYNVTPGGVALINPDVVHTGTPIDDRGWTYRVFYPDVAVLTEITGSDSPWFTEPVAYDPAAAAAILAAHRAAESGDRLAASASLVSALGGLWRRYGGRRTPEEPAGHAVSQTREILHERLVDPPTLAELAATVGVGQYALVRSFREKHGLPPHAYLNQLRVRRAAALLAEGVPVATVAVTVGFTDQSHLTRHFRRAVGVPPGQYRRKNVQERRGRDT